MSLTRIIRPYIQLRQQALARQEQESDALQRAVLTRLLHTARHTAYGRDHGFAGIRNYEDFARQVPLNSYEDLKEAIDRTRHGESDLLWPGRIRWFAKSSGTTSDKSKFIPVSPASLRDIHYKGGFDTVAFYLKNHPDSRLFDGKALILGGSHAPNYNVKESLVGDLSAILIENVSPLIQLIRVPCKETALLDDFEEKRERIARETLRMNVTNISGVPSWMLSVLHRVLELSGKDRIDEVWPNLEVFFHGGVSFTPYRRQYAHIITLPGMHYMETYNASEGFFGIQDNPADPALRLMTDYGVFYEFIPLEELDADHPQPAPPAAACGATSSGTPCVSPPPAPTNSSSPDEPGTSSTLSAKSSSSTTPNRAWPGPAKRPAPKCWNTPPPPSSWTTKPAAATSG